MKTRLIAMLLGVEALVLVHAISSCSSDSGSSGNGVGLLAGEGGESGSSSSMFPPGKAQALVMFDQNRKNGGVIFSIPVRECT